MNTDQLQQWARDVGATAYRNRHYPDPTYTFSVDRLAAFAEMVRDQAVAAERERRVRPLRTVTYVCPVCAASLERQEVGTEDDEEIERLRGERYRLQEQIANDTAEIHGLRGENSVLLSLLADCASVIRTIEPDDSDEGEKLRELLAAIDCAMDPHRHKGALL